MSFQDNLATLPSIDHLNGLNILDSDGQIIHHIPAQAGKLGSLKVYYALAQRHHHRLNSAAAQEGLELFAEHVADAEQNPGKHPNIDLLNTVLQQKADWQLQPIEK